MDKRVLLNKLQEMGMGAAKIAELTGIPDSRVRQWYAGRGLPKVDDFNKLLKLHAKYTKRPTNDFVEKQLAQEPEAEYKSYQQENTDLKNKLISALEKINILQEKISLMEANKTAVSKPAGHLNKVSGTAEQLENDRILEHVAEEGAKAGLWASKESGIVTLGKFLLSFQPLGARVGR